MAVIKWVGFPIRFVMWLVAVPALAILVVPVALLFADDEPFEIVRVCAVDGWHDFVLLRRGIRYRARPEEQKP
jgi:hypothetical protein